MKAKTKGKKTAKETRINYFNGAMLKAEDLTREQTAGRSNVYLSEPPKCRCDCDCGPCSAEAPRKNKARRSKPR